MKSQNPAIVFAALALSTGAAYAGGKPLAERSPKEQYDELKSRDMPYGITAMDEVGDKISPQGRYGFLTQCLGMAWEQQGHTNLTLAWALCGDDVKKLDMEQLHDLFTSDYEFKQELERVERWKKAGATIEAEAKTDKGIRQILDLAEKSKAEWKAYLAKNEAAFTTYVKLKNALASGKTNAPGFEGCWDATQPAFAKLVQSTKFPWDAEGDPLPSRLRTMVTSTESYITVASFAACAYSIDSSGAGLVDAAFSAPVGTIRVGWRTVFIGHAKEESFQPKFADRSLSLGSMLSGYDMNVYTGFQVAAASIATPGGGEIKKVTKKDDETVLAFKGTKIDSCLHWVDTNRIQSYAVNGDPIYARVCKKRGQVDEQEHDTTISTKFAAGLAPGVKVTIVNGLPVEAWKGKKFVAIFGVLMK